MVIEKNTNVARFICLALLYAWGGCLSVTEPNTVPLGKEEVYSLVVEKQKIELKSLRLHKMLVSLLHNIEKQKTALGADQSFEREDIDLLFAAHTLVEKALASMEKVVNGFNNERFVHTPELAHHFVGMCNALVHTESTSMAHLDLYDMQDRIRKFNKHIMQYCAMYSTFLEPEDVEFFQDLNHFGYAVMFCLMQERLFGFGIIDLFANFIFFKPLRQMLDHPWLVMGVVALGFILLSGEFLWLYNL